MKNQELLDKFDEFILKNKTNTRIYETPLGRKIKLLVQKTGNWKKKGKQRKDCMLGYKKMKEKMARDSGYDVIKHNA